MHGIYKTRLGPSNIDPSSGKVEDSNSGPPYYKSGSALISRPYHLLGIARYSVFIFSSVAGSYLKKSYTITKPGHGGGAIQFVARKGSIVIGIIAFEFIKFD